MQSARHFSSLLFNPAGCRFVSFRNPPTLLRVMYIQLFEFKMLQSDSLFIHASLSAGLNLHNLQRSWGDETNATGATRRVELTPQSIQ